MISTHNNAWPHVKLIIFPYTKTRSKHSSNTTSHWILGTILLWALCWTIETKFKVLDGIPSNTNLLSLLFGKKLRKEDPHGNLSWLPFENGKSNFVDEERHCLFACCNMGAEELRHPHSSAALFARISCRASDVKSIEDAASNCPGCDQQKSFLFLNRIPGVDAAISNLNGDGSFRWLRNPRNIEEFAVLGQTIGSGAFADVFRARDIKSGQVVAVKQLEFKEEIDRCTRREIDLLACLRHPSIVELKEVAVDSGLQNLYLVMEYVGTDLRKVITKKVPRLSNWNVKHLMSQLLKGVSFMHRNGFLHRDLKPENLLVNEEMQLKICDFGLARRFDENKNYSVNVVTLWYRAPELLLGAPEYSEAVDVWAIGCIMAELMLQQPLFRGKTEVDQLDKIFRILGTPDLKCWPDFVTLTQGSHWSPYPGTLDLIKVSTEYPLEDAAYDLLNKLLTYDPKKRITAEDALKHDWFCSDSGDWMAGLE